VIDPGRMDRLIRFQQDSGSTRSASGQVIPNWEDIDNPEEYAMVHSFRGDESFMADKKSATRRRNIVIWYRDDITEMMTILYDDKRWDIRSIEEIGRREGLSIEMSWTQGQYDS